MSEDPFGLAFPREEEQRPAQLPPEPTVDPAADVPAATPTDGAADAPPATPAGASGSPSSSMQATWAVPDAEPEPAKPAMSIGGTAVPAAPESSFTPFLRQLAGRGDLSRTEAAAALQQMVDGTASETEAAAFLMGLKVKGETANEIAGLLEVMRRLAVPVEFEDRDALVDIVGTGGDQLGTFNISTAAAFVVAGAGVKVAKHGNRAASSRCGSADVLEALGVRVDLEPADVATCIREVGMGFMLASRHHPAMAKVAGVRRTLGVSTVFNLLGPLTNPASVQRMVLGVSSPEHLEVLAGALARVGCKHALLVRSDEGMDEVSVASATTVLEVERGVVQPAYSLSPEELGVQRWALRGLLGGDPAANAFIIKGVLSGSKGAPRDAAIVNAGAALYVSGAVSSIREGVDTAAAAIDDGRAQRVLESLSALTSRLAEGRA